MRLLPGVVFKEGNQDHNFPAAGSPCGFLFLHNNPFIFAERLDEQSITQ
jgi:hypothetical protein